MHGDLALVEASLSTVAFMNLVNLGVPFPQDSFGQFVGYKTDHDPRQRATSIGPYTSREMCRHLIQEVQRLGISILERRTVIELVTLTSSEPKRLAGVLALSDNGDLETYLAENIIFAVGGPGGLYKSSVYPTVQTGAIGLALMAGADANNLPESQYGLSSTKFRWNVSGTYMQVIPRVISCGDGKTDECEFLRPYFASAGEMNGNVFLKGYQWPFDAARVIGGSSLIDILVYIETELKGRRVCLDFRSNPEGFSFDALPEEARQYLTKSNALQATPLERLRTMNPDAIKLYLDHGIDLATEPLEVAVCAQHNNGGLAGNIWWESTNIRHFFPIGEVNGSHGLKRPGGAAINAGQVGGFRAAQYIANRYAEWTLTEEQVIPLLEEATQKANVWADKCNHASRTWQSELAELKERMSRAGAHIRSLDQLKLDVPAAWQQVHRLEADGCAIGSPIELKEAFRTRQLCFAHAVYLDAILFALQSGVGSRGSAIVLDKVGRKIHESLDEQWLIQPEDTAYRSRVLETTATAEGIIYHRWTACRPIPEPDSWFETTWSRFRSGEIYQSE